VKANLSPVVAIALATLTISPRSNAELPVLQNEPWLGYFAGFSNKRFHLGVTPQGDIEMYPLTGKNDPVGKQLAIKIDAGVEETQATGRVVIKKIKEESLESSESPTGKLEKTSIRGEVTGGAKFELNIEQARGIIYLGGRILDRGKLTKNPLRFVVRVNVPNMYPYQDHDPGTAEDSKREKEKKAQKVGKAFQKKVKSDLLLLTWTDGNRVRQDFEKIVDVTSPTFNGPGITSVDVDASSYEGKRLVFTAAPNSAMTLRNPSPAPLHEGFTIIWAADSSKDPQNKAKLAMEVR